MKPFPSTEVTKKFKTAQSADNTALSSTITVPANEYAVLWKLWVDLDVATEADIEACAPRLQIDITMGSQVFAVYVHPFLAHVDAQVVVAEHRQVDMGPWFFDFGPDGLYSGVRGDNIVVGVEAAGVGIKTRVNYLYTGD